MIAMAYETVLVIQHSFSRPTVGNVGDGVGGGATDVVLGALEGSSYPRGSTSSIEMLSTVCVMAQIEAASAQIKEPNESF